MTFGGELLAAVCDGAETGGEVPELRHVADLAARPAATADWPGWASVEVVSALRSAGIERPWCHQVEAAELAHRGHDVVISTGTASGKSLAFQLPIMAALGGDPRRLHRAP